MKTIVIITLFILVIQNGFGQFILDKENNINIYGEFISDCKIENLIGKVKSVKALSFNGIDSVGNYIKTSYYFPKEIGWVCYYDSEGNLLSMKKLTDSLDLTIDRAKYQNIFAYNNYKSPKSITKKEFSSREESKSFTYTYGKQGEILSLKALKNNGDLYFNYLFKYDKSSKKVATKKIENWQGKNTNKYEFKNLENGNLELTTYDDGNLDDIYIFDREGRIVEFKEHNLKIVSRSPMKTKSYYNIDTYQYDINGNIISHLSKSGDLLAKSIPLKTFKYEYDENNNWIKKIAFKDGKLIFINERIIEYYE